MFIEIKLKGKLWFRLKISGQNGIKKKTAEDVNLLTYFFLN